MTKQILAFLFCFTRELNLYSPLTLTLPSARELKPLLPPYRPPIRPYLHPPPMASRFEQKNSLQHKNVVTTKPTQLSV